MKIKRKKKPVARAQAAEPASRFPSLDEVCKPDMIAYHFWREWFRARDRSDYDFMYAMSGEGSALRQALGPRDEFGEACRRRRDGIPGLSDGDLWRIRLDGPDLARVIRTCGHDDRSRSTYTAERWAMRRDEAGWRITQVDEIVLPRSDGREAASLESFAEIPIA